MFWYCLGIIQTQTKTYLNKQLHKYLNSFWQVLRENIGRAKYTSFQVIWETVLKIFCKSFRTLLFVNSVFSTYTEPYECLFRTLRCQISKMECLVKQLHFKCLKGFLLCLRYYTSFVIKKLVHLVTCALGKFVEFK